MWKIILVPLFRFLKRNTSYILLNLSGMAIGIACSISIMLWVIDELSYDKNFENYKHIYRLVYSEELQSGTLRSAATPAPYGPSFKEIIPEIRDFFRVKPYTRGKTFTYRENKILEKNLLYADSSILQILGFDFLIGDKHSLDGLNDVILTQSTANKYFGTEYPVGKIIMFEDTVPLRVNGVIRDLPDNIHLKFDILLNFGQLAKSGWKTGWYNRYYFTYFLLDNNADPIEINSKLCQSLANYMNAGPNAEITADLLPDLYLQPLRDVHLRSDFDIDLYGASHSRVRYVYFLSVIGLLILIICAINYTNLAIAYYSGRDKETGIRKILGATRLQLISGFITEAFMFSIVAYLAGLLLAEILLPQFNLFTAKDLSFDFTDWRLVVGAVATITFTSILSGAYPALYISLLPVVKSKRTRKTRNAAGFRKGLVVTQFALGALLITGTLTVKRQMSFIHAKNLGLDTKNIICFRASGTMQKKFGVFQQELQKSPSVLNVTCASALPTNTVHSTEAYFGKDDNKIVISQESVGHNYLEAMHIPVVSGRNFELSVHADSSNFIINQTAAKLMGLENPVGERFELSGKRGKIIGVMQDFNFKSLYYSIGPLVYHIGKKIGPYILVRINGKDMQNGIAVVKDAYEQINPVSPFDYTLLESEYAGLYSRDDKTGQLFSIFSVVAIFLAFLGFFGLASFMVRQRTREIAIRKTFGASAIQVAVMLQRRFTQWIIIANFIALPFAFVIMKNWLNKFAYRVTLNPEDFVFALILSVIVAWAAQIYQIRKAALMNPVDALKYE